MSPAASLALAVAATTVLASAVVGPTTAVASPASDGSVLLAGQSLLPGAQLTSATGEHVLVMQADGNLVEYGPDGVEFASGTAGNPGARLILARLGGALTVATAPGTTLWTNRVAAADPTRLVIHDDGDLVEFAGDGTALWSSHAATSTILAGESPAASRWQVASPAGRFVLDASASGVTLTEYEGFSAPTQTVSAQVWAPLPPGRGDDQRLVLQTDGNLVVYAGTIALWSSRTAGAGADRMTVQDDGNLVLYRPDGVAVWASASTPRLLVSGQRLTPGTRWQVSGAGTTPDSLLMQPDGNLVVYSPLGVPNWFTGTSGHPGATALLQGDANLVVYAADGAPLWASATGGCGNRVFLEFQSSAAVGALSLQSVGSSYRFWLSGAGPRC